MRRFVSYPRVSYDGPPAEQAKFSFYRLVHIIYRNASLDNMSTRALTLPVDAPEVASETSSTLKAFGVLEVLVRAGRAVTLSELMQATELPKPTLHRTLALFEEAGILAREPGGRAYIIGERLSRFALDVLRNDARAAERSRGTNSMARISGRRAVAACTAIEATTSS